MVVHWSTLRPQLQHLGFEMLALYLSPLSTAGACQARGDQRQSECVDDKDRIMPLRCKNHSGADGLRGDILKNGSSMRRRGGEKNVPAVVRHKNGLCTAIKKNKNMMQTQ